MPELNEQMSLDATIDAINAACEQGDRNEAWRLECLLAGVKQEDILPVPKCFVANQWVITPEAIWGFLETHGESVDKEKVARILQEQQTEGGKI